MLYSLKWRLHRKKGASKNDIKPLCVAVPDHIVPKGYTF